MNASATLLLPPLCFCINCPLERVALDLCSMQMLTDWSRTRFLNVVFTSIIISSHVETCETVYLFVIRICRILYVSTIV